MIRYLSVGSALLSFSAFSFPIYNNITGVGPTEVATPIPYSQVNAYMCVTDSSGTTTTISPGDYADSSVSGNVWYFGAALRYGGCDSSDTYIGYLGISLTSSGVNTSVTPTFTGNSGVPITLNNPSVSSLGNDSYSVTGEVAYTQISSNFTMTPPPDNVSAWDFVGINLSGLEFSAIINPYVIPNLSVEDSSTSYTDLTNTQLFINGGVNTIRIPVSWDYLLWNSEGSNDEGTPIADQSFNNYYYYYLQPLLETLTSTGVYTIIDLHTYFRYSIYGSQYSGCSSTPIPPSTETPPCPDGTLNTNVADYEAVWGQLIDAMKSDSSINMDYIMIDLINEPVNVPDDTVFTLQADLINYIRNTKGFTGYILVEGNCWTGLHSWATCTWDSSDGTTTYSNATLFTKEKFAAAGIDTSKILINVHEYFDSDYSGTSSTCLQDLTTTGPNGFNLNAFVTWLNENELNAFVSEFGTGTDEATCKPTLTQFMQYLQANSANVLPYGFKGWTIWSTGHGWGTYNLVVTPSTSTCYQWDVLQGFLQ